MPYRVDIIVPVYNERENFAALYGFIVKNVHSDWRLLLAYDFPEDTTLLVAKPLAQKDSRVLLIQNNSRGVLEAIKTGFPHAEAEAVLVVMVDETEEFVQTIDALVEIFYREGATIVAPSRYMKGGKSTGSPFIKGLLSRAGGISLRWFTGLAIHDATNNTRLYRKSFLDRIRIESTHGFELALELTVKAHLAGEKLSEMPIVWRERTVGASRFQLFRWLPSYLYWYFFGILKHNARVFKELLTPGSKTS